MASIATQIQLYDLASGPLMNITNALNATLNAFHSVDQAANSTFDTATFDYAREQLNKANAALVQMEENLRRNEEQQNRFNNSLNRGTSAASNLEKKLRNIAAAYLSIQSVRQTIGLSDQMAQTRARLELIIDDKGSVEDLEKKIFAVARNSRASFNEVADSVAKLGLTAGKAFKNTDEILAFTELMNKNFIIAGTSAQEQAAAMYQLTQAMASGRLQGDEFRSIIENAPLLAKSIEDYMINVKKAKGTMKDWAKEGMLTADVIKAAVFRSADEIEKRFEKMPRTFADTWTQLKNDALMAFNIVLQKLNEIANSEEFQMIIQKARNALITMANIGVQVVDVLGKGIKFLADNWSTVVPLFWAATAAMGAYVLITKTAVLWTGLKAAAMGVAGTATALYNITLAAAAFATGNLTLAQHALNAAMMANPILLIVALIGLLVFWIYRWIQSVGDLQIAWKICMHNILKAWDAVKIGFFTGVYWILNLWDRLGLGIKTASIAIANFIGNMKSNVLMILQNMINGAIGLINEFITLLNRIPGVSIDTVQQVTFGTTAKLEEEVARQAREAELANYRSQIEAAAAEREAKLNQMFTDAKNAAIKRQAEIEKMQAEVAARNKQEDGFDFQFDFSDYLTPIANEAKKNRENTDKIKKSLDLTLEDLKHLRELAEREAINRFTLAEIKVDMGGITNNVNSAVDLDGVIDYLTDGVTEALQMVAEGVHL